MKLLTLILLTLTIKIDHLNGLKCTSCSNVETDSNSQFKCETLNKKNFELASISCPNGTEYCVVGDSNY
jgi:hypothetical protein